MNGILLIDKPGDFSSNGVLQKIRHHLGKPKAGHAGTLDPLATGMLPICLGKATKINQFLLDKAKYYTATLKFGVQTTTDDITGDVIATYDISPITLELAPIRQVIDQFIGQQKQLPPQYSAIKHQGRPLYSYARKGIYINKPKRDIHIYHLDIIALTPPYLTLEVHCSKGTYIRSLVRDIGEKIGYGATLTRLRREWIEPFGNREQGANNMLSLKECLSLKRETIINNYLYPMDSAIATMPSIQLEKMDEIKLKQGQKIQVLSNTDEGLSRSHLYRIYNEEKMFIAIGEMRDGILKTKRLLI